MKTITIFLLSLILLISSAYGQEKNYKEELASEALVLTMCTVVSDRITNYFLTKFNGINEAEKLKEILSELAVIQTMSFIIRSQKEVFFAMLSDINPHVAAELLNYSFRKLIEYHVEFDKIVEDPAYLEILYTAYAPCMLLVSDSESEG